MQLNRILLIAVLVLNTVHVCADVPEKQDGDTKLNDVYDPIEGYNRAMFDINWTLDKVFLRPVAEAYSFVPSTARKGVRNFLTNVKAPVTFLNDIFQLEGMRAGQTLVRTLINTTLGIGGLFDVATNMGLDYHSEDFGQTLAVSGLPSGPYIILPLLGPSTPRDMAGRGVDVLINPVNWVLMNADLDSAMYIRDGVDMLDQRTEARGFTDELEKAIDPYARVRSLYWQSRVSNIDDSFEDNDSPKPTDSE